MASKEKAKLLENLIDKLDKLEVETSEIEGKADEAKGENVEVSPGPSIQLKDEASQLVEDLKNQVFQLQAKNQSLLENMGVKENKFHEAIGELKNELQAELETLKRNQGELENKLNQIKSSAIDLTKNQVEAAKTEKEKEPDDKAYDASLKNGIFELERWFLLQGEQMNSFVFQQKYWTSPADFTWKVEHMKRTLSNKSWSFSSSDFKLNGYLFKGRCKLQGSADEQMATLQFSFKDFINTGRVIPFRLVPAVRYVLKAKGAPNLTLSEVHRFKEEVMYGTKYFKVKFNKEMLKDSSYYAEDSLAIEVFVESPSAARHVYSYDGSLTWVIQDFKNCKDLEAKGLSQAHIGPYFYTSPRGYRVRFRLFLNGRGEGKMMTAEITFLTGEFDANLTKSFPHKAKVTIFNTRDPTKHKTYEKKENIVKQSSYTFDTMGEKDVENYVFDDTLVYKVTIDEM